MFRTSNPALKDDVFVGIPSDSTVMTVNGTVTRTAILLALCTGAAIFTYNNAQAMPAPWLIAGAIGGFITAIITIFNKRLAPITAPIYAVGEGLLLGAISALFEAQYPGIAFAAIGLTIGTLATMLFVYRTGLVRATEGFKLGVFAATGGIALFYLVAIILGLFGVPVPMLHSTGPIGIAFSLFVVVIAALNLVLDFDLIERGAASAAPKYMEWYAAFALMVTLVWLYLEILRLLSKLRRR
jgi:uncharacterized YccA/Bax inhibitor family protein